MKTNIAIFLFLIAYSLLIKTETESLEMPDTLKRYIKLRLQEQKEEIKHQEILKKASNGQELTAQERKFLILKLTIC